MLAEWLRLIAITINWRLSWQRLWALIFTQLLESPIPPLTAAALRMIICKRPAPPDDHLQEAGPSRSSFVRGRPLILTTTTRARKVHFWDPSQWDKMCFERRRIQVQWEKNQNFHICLRSGPRWLTPPSPPYGQPDRKISVFFDNSLKDDEHSGNSRYDNGRRWWSWWTSRWLPSWAKTLVSNAIRGEGGDEASWHDQTSLKDKHFENRPHEYIAPVAWLNVHSRESIRIVGKS